jgi:hypothetical protein
MVIVKATKNSEAGVLPKRATAHGDGQIQRGTDQGRRDAGGRGASSKLERRAGQVFWRTANGIDGPFAETKELVAGFWLWKCASLPEAIEWAKRCPNPMPGEEAELEIRQVFEAEDFGAEFTPELREQEERLRAEIEKNQAR